MHILFTVLIVMASTGAAVAGPFERTWNSSKEAAL